MKANGPTFHHYLSERLNRYTCDTCRDSIVTVDSDHGTTPFMIECKATKDCNGSMQSSFYRVSGRPDPQLGEAAASQWRPRETAPKDGTPFLTWCPTGECFEIGEWYELFADEYELIEGTDTYRKVSKKYSDGFNCNWFDWWMPLPKPPSREAT